MAIAASSVSLSAPYAIFPLPLPLHQTRAKDREGGTYRACFTSQVESTKKRRRGGASEIVVAVDGEGVNIYDVRATQIISTYALPPTTKFSCAPTSSFVRAAKKSSPFSRRTYAAVSAPKKQLLCWEEQGVSSTDDKAEAINHLSCNSESRQDIVYLQDLSAGRKRSAEGGLLAVYADGYIRCFSSDLKSERWEFTPQHVDVAKKDFKVVYAASASLAMAKKALLKNRPDVILPEPAAEAEASEDTILFTVSRRGTIFEARIFSIPPITEENKTSRELLVLTLPGSAPTEDDASGSSVFSIHFPTGTLNFLSAEKLTTYALTSTIPSIISSLHLSSASPEDPTPSSLLRISPTTVLVATNENVSLYDTKFTSLQARVPIQANPTTTTTSTPTVSRSSTPASTTAAKINGGVFLTAYLSELDLAIGYSQNGIVAVQISRGGSKEEGRKSGLLIDSLCRGVDGLEMPVTDGKRKVACGPAMKKILGKLSSEKARLATVLAKLQEARKEENLEKFEGAFADYIGVKRITPQAAGGDTAMTNGDTTPAEASLETSNNSLPEFNSKQLHKPLSHEFVTAVLALIFEPSTNADDEQTLTINFYPPNVIKHLAESGNLSTTLLPGRTTSTLLSCLSSYDPTLRTLEWALTTLAALSAAETVTAIAVALTPADTNDDDLALKVIRSEVLRLALGRLDTFPASVIISAFKAELSGEKLMELVTLLRRELSVQDEDLRDHEDVGVGIGDMGIVSSLLTAALDSIGIGGLVLVDDADMFIAGLHEEVGDAVDAIEEAAGLKGILEEIFRHADWRRVAIERRESENEHTAREAEEKAERRRGKREKAEGRRKRLEIREKKVEEEPEGEAQKNAVVVAAAPKDAVPLTTPARRRADPRKTPGTARKARLARADPASRAAHIVRLQARRKPRTPHQKRHGQKTQGGSVSALLPLGLAPPPPSSLVGMGPTVRGPVGSGMGAEVERREIERKWGREANYRESLVAGVYSVESIVV